MALITAAGGSGHLFVRLVNATGRILEKDLLSCTVEFEGKATKVFTNLSLKQALNEDDEHSTETAIDIPEYYGGATFKITLSISHKPPSYSLRERLALMWFRASTTTTACASQIFVMRNAIPNNASRSAKRHATTCCWQDFWPRYSFHFDSVVEATHVELAMLFVPQHTRMDPCSELTELHKAAYLGDVKMLKFLIQQYLHTGLITARTKEGLNALDISCMQGDYPAVKAIINESQHGLLWTSHHGGGGGSDSRTSLHRAVLGGNVQCIICLAEYYGRNQILTQQQQTMVIDVQDDNGYTALMLCCERGEDMLPAVQVLVECGANLELCNKQGDTALLISCRAGSVQCSLALLEAREPFNPQSASTHLARPNMANLAGERSLDLACSSHNCPELIRALLAAHAVPGMRRPSGSTALHCAANSGFEANCRELVSWLETNMVRSAIDVHDSLAQHVCLFPGSAYAQSLYFTLYRDNAGRLASAVALEHDHDALAKYLLAVEQNHMALAQLHTRRCISSSSSNEGEEEPYSIII